MSQCIPINGGEKKCLGCGQPILTGETDYKKKHVTVVLTLPQQQLDGCEFECLHNPRYEYTVHSLECLSKVKPMDVKLAVLEAANCGRVGKKLTIGDIDI